MFVSAAEPAAKAPAAPAVAQPSAAEQVIAGVREIVSDLSRLDPQEAGLNLLFSALIVVAALGLVWSLRRIFDYWLQKFAAGAPAGGKRPETPQAVGVTWLLLKLAIAAGTLLLVAGVWGIDVLDWLSAGAGAGLLRAIGVVILAVGAVEVAGFVVNRLIDGVAKRSRNSRRAAQIRTLGPLIRGFIQTVFVVIATLTFLSEIGVKVGPLLASAGVVGVAVGFGAQTLVKDFLTGLFLVAEDVVSVGDNVRIADAGGTVEAMTLRTIRLRDQDGTLHIFPYSEAQVIHNRTASFSSYVADVLVTYGTDLDHAMAVMGRVGEEMRKSPEFARKITKPFEVLGVERLDPTGVILKGRATTRPKDQWEVGREYNRRLKQAFDEEGIEIAYRPVGPPAATAPTAPEAEDARVEVEAKTPEREKPKSVKPGS
jgi:moderate conductance mechanosensitive channel